MRISEAIQFHPFYQSEVGEEDRNEAEHSLAENLKDPPVKLNYPELVNEYSDLEDMNNNSRNQYLAKTSDSVNLTTPSFTKL